jgi:hypothetical protein
MKQGMKHLMKHVREDEKCPQTYWLYLRYVANHNSADKSSQVEYKEPLDWGTPSTQDDQSSDEDLISNKLAATAGLSHLSLTPAPTRWSSHAPSSRSSKGKQREVRRFGGDDQDNNPDSHAYDDHGYNRLVSTKFTVCTLTKDKKNTAIK